MPTRYFIAIPDPAAARGAGDFAFRAHGADAFAQELQEALRGDQLFERWRATQDEPDEVDPLLGATDPAAHVEGTQRDTAFRFSQEDKVAVFYWIDGPFGYALSGEFAKPQLLDVATSVYKQLNP